MWVHVCALYHYHRGWQVQGTPVLAFDHVWALAHLEPVCRKCWSIVDVQPVSRPEYRPFLGASFQGRCSKLVLDSGEWRQWSKTACVSFQTRKQALHTWLGRVLSNRWTLEASTWLDRDPSPCMLAEPLENCHQAGLSPSLLLYSSLLSVIFKTR